MYLKKHRVFAYLRQNIDGFLDFVQNGIMPTRKEYKEPFDECLERYKELVNDPFFLSKVYELAYLETILIQSKCASKVVPSFYNQPNKYPLIYARSSYPSLRKNYNHVTVSMGQSAKQTKSINQLSNDPLFIHAAQTKILKNMEKEFHYKEYKLKFRRDNV
jgi:hypothetical protein